MHQQNQNHRSPNVKPSSSTPTGLEETREATFRGGREEEERFDFPLDYSEVDEDDWEAEDPTIFFGGLDFDERRVDLPCDDDGKVFLAPHRQPEDLRNQDNAGLLSDKRGLLAAQIAVDDKDVASAEPSQREFGFRRDGDPEKTSEPKPNTDADLPVRRDTITGAFISLKSLPTSGVEETQSRDEGGENEWAGEQLTLPSIGTGSSPDSLTDSKAVASRITGTIKAAMSSIAQRAFSSLQTVSQVFSASIAASYAGLGSFSKTAHQSLLELMQKASKFLALSGDYLKRSGKAVNGPDALAGWTSMLSFRAGSMSLFAMLGRQLSSLSTGLGTVAAACLVTLGELFKALRLRLPIAGRARLNDTRNVISVLGAAFSNLTTKAIRVSAFIGQKLTNASSRHSGAIGLDTPAVSANGHGAVASLQAALRQPYQFLIGSRTRTSKEQSLDPGVSLKAKGISFVMKSTQNLVALGSISKNSIRLPLGGLAGVAAAVVLLVSAWSGTPRSMAPSIVLTFPPKPVEVEKKLSHDPIILEWPALEIPTRESENIRVGDPSRAGVSSTEGRPLLSPEAAMAALVEQAAGNAFATSLTNAQPSVAGVDNSSWGTRPDRAAKLVAMTMLADIETIKNTSEFTRALRIVGLETLIQPGQQYTILIPSDAAFAKLGQDELEELFHPSGHDQLRVLLSNHILKERLKFDDFAGEVGSYLSMADQAITISATDVIKVENASMIETDLRAANAMVHVIDDVLVFFGPNSNPRPQPETAFEAGSET